MSNTRTISITRALQEKKLLEKRIHKAIADFAPIVILIGDSTPAGYNTAEHYADAQMASWQSINALMLVRDSIVGAIANSNATTKITVGKTEMTVAEAIEKKKSIVDITSFLHQTLKQRYANVLENMSSLSTREAKAADNEILEFSKKDKTIPEEQMRLFHQSVERRHKVTLLNPINVSQKIMELEATINDFLTNVDIALTESNSTTKIVVSE